MNILDRFRLKENTKNYPGFENTQYKNIIDKSILHHKREDRYKELNKALDIINEEVPVTAIYHWKNPYLVQPYVKGMLVSPSGIICIRTIEIDEKNKSKR